MAVSKDGARATAGTSRDAKPPRKRAGNKEVGQALRTVYDQTVGESIPAEMLDLLGKLS